MTPATVRFFCVVGPRTLRGATLAGEAGWGEVSFAFLRALWDAQTPVRAVTIGASHIHRHDDRLRGLLWSHWQPISDAFVRDVGRLQVNVVCSPLDLVMGTTLTRRAVAPPHVPGAPRERMDTDADDPIYHPSTAFSSLWTAGLCNVAITSLAVYESLSDAERAALEQYQHVLTPHSPEALWAAGLTAARVVAAADLPEYLTRCQG